MANPVSTRTLAATAWRTLFDFFVRTRGQRDAVLERFALTPNDAKALNSLHATVGQPMRALADAWGTDAPNATWVIDRLERKGLAERRTAPHDRRVKLVVLTARGAKTRDEILRAFHTPPPELLALGREDLAALERVLRKLAAPARVHAPTSPHDRAPPQ